MVQRHTLRVALHICAAAGVVLFSRPLRANEVSTQQQLERLQQQNELLQQQLHKQQELIESLSRKVNEIQTANTQRDQQVDQLHNEMSEASVAPKSTSPFSLGKVSISGEGGVGLFHSGSQGMFPNWAFRVDEAKLFVEAPVWNNVYFYSEINLATRDQPDLNLQLGELYLDFENVSRFWDMDHLVNVRAGRMDIPFGEEYQTRDVIDNPFISRSLSDLWGIDEGLELYGRAGKVSYVVAVQNGGFSQANDFTSDKSVAGRIGYDPTRWLHLSVSAMRTGNLANPNDVWSELWFANAWFVPLSTNSTQFHANLVEGDVQLRWKSGHAKFFGGYINYDDNDPVNDNQRDIYYYSAELVQDISRGLYAGARFSQILAGKGYPIVGNGNFNQFLFGPRTTDLWLLSLDLGYRWSENLVVKLEYSFERGKLVTGETRNDENLFAFETAFKF